METTTSKRMLAAKKLYDLAKCYEKVTFQKVYKQCFFQKNGHFWKFIGKAHDYSY